MAVSLELSDFGRLPDGTAVELFTVRNSDDVSVSVSSWGGIVTSVRTPDRSGVVGEITLAHNTLEEYLAGHPYYGALVGRVCNRITDGGFELNGRRYDLPLNHQGTIHLHGGIRGFDRRIYHAEPLQDEDSAGVRLSRVSPDGEEGYPGNLSVTHTVTLTRDNRLLFDFQAETDAPTVVNLTNHTYWNLSGESTILDHELHLNAQAVAEADQRAVPTGKLLPVADGPFDFAQWRAIRPGFEQLQAAGVNGFDHSLLVAGSLDDTGRELRELREAARVRAPASGRMMVVRTTYPAVHLYTGNNLAGELSRSGEHLKGQEALCLECQMFPDAPHRPEFPSIVLEPGRLYHHTTEHRFSVF